MKRICPSFRLVWVVALMQICIAQFAMSGCGHWVANGQWFPYQEGTHILDVIFDGSTAKYAMIRLDSWSGIFSLWHGDGLNWQKTWEGTSGSVDYRFMEPSGFYFDPKLNAIVMFGWISYGPEYQQSVGAYKYDTGGSWMKIAEIDWVWCSMPRSPILWDAERERAIMPLCLSMDNSSFLEFDGTSFHRIQYPEPHYFQMGMAGYDPLRKVIVFWGGADLGDIEPFGTYEYNGDSWRKIATTKQPLEPWSAGIVWHPGLAGMLALHCSGEQQNATLISRCESWLYKDQDWQRIESQKIDTYAWPVIMYPNATQDSPMVAASYYNEEDGEQWVGLSFIESIHCRPSSKP